jgi:hypothetical protein
MLLVRPDVPHYEEGLLMRYGTAELAGLSERCGVFLARSKRGLNGQGLGAELLVTAIGTIVGAARAAGGRLIVVDALDDAAASFYERHDVQRLHHRTDRRIMKLSAAANALGQPWPSPTLARRTAQRPSAGGRAPEASRDAA